MQTIELIETVRWLEEIVPASTKSFFFGGGWRRLLTGEGSSPDFVNEAFEATHDLASVVPRISEHRYAVQILEAFGLDGMLAKDFAIDSARGFVERGRQEQNLDELHRRYIQLQRNWEVLTRSIPLIEKLTVPSIVAKEQDFDDILTLEIRTHDHTQPDISTIEDLLGAASKLYLAIARATFKGDVDALQVVYLTSGSGFRFDLKGLGEPMKQLKELLVEAWEKIRHRKSDDFDHRVQSVIKGLDVLSKIGAQENLDHETRLRLTHDITEGMLDLFHAGALPREIRTVEVVSNIQLIENFQQKLLPKPEYSKEPVRKKAGARPAKKAASGKKQRKI